MSRSGLASKAETKLEFDPSNHPTPRKSSFAGQKPLPIFMRCEKLRLVERRNKIAEKVQNTLLEFSDSIHTLDGITDELHELSRDPDARGVGATASRWHPLVQASRLRAVIALALRGTNYSRLVRQPLLTPPDSAIDFAEVEARVGTSLIAELEAEIRQIDTLEKKQEVA